MAHNPPRYDPGRHGPIDTVWMAHMSGRVLWAFCRNCGHVAQVNAWSLAKQCRSETTPLEEAAKKFCCTKCHHRSTILIPASGLAHA